MKERDALAKFDHPFLNKIHVAFQVSRSFFGEDAHDVRRPEANWE